MIKFQHTSWGTHWDQNRYQGVNVYLGVMGDNIKIRIIMKTSVWKEKRFITKVVGIVPTKWRPGTQSWLWECWHPVSKLLQQACLIALCLCTCPSKLFSSHLSISILMMNESIQYILAYQSTCGRLKTSMCPLPFHKVNRLLFVPSLCPSTTFWYTWHTLWISVYVLSSLPVHGSLSTEAVYYFSLSSVHST
jgi:hypothetical protein